jgi:hypothetical protein
VKSGKTQEKGAEINTAPFFINKYVYRFVYRVLCIVMQITNTSPVEAKMLKHLIYKLSAVETAKIIFVVQLVILLAVILATLAAHDVALAGFADGGIGSMGISTSGFADGGIGS